MISKELNRIIDKYRHVDNIEIEIRFGWNHKRDHGNNQGFFNTNIRERYFSPLLNRMKESNDNLSLFDEHTCKTTNVFCDNDKTNARVITSEVEKNICHYKYKLEVVDFNIEGTAFDIRVVVSKELPYDYNDVKTMTHVRKRCRNSFTYKMWIYDLTISTYSQPVNDEQIVYEFEIELDCKKANLTNCTTSYLSKSLLLKINDIVEMKLVDTEVIHLKNYVHMSNRTINQHLLHNVCHSIQKL